MSRKIYWLNGEWGSEKELRIPISDRGLNLGDGLFETILILNGYPQLLTAHLDRLYRGASLLGMDAPPKRNYIHSLIKEGIQQLFLKNLNGAVRLNWSRGDSSQRGISITQGKRSDQNHRFWVEMNSFEPIFNPISTMISQYEQRNAYSRISTCKTLSYSQAIQARHEANLAGFDDALLLSTKGEMSCGSTSNILIKRANQWLTPRLESGCLPGIMRQQGLNAGLIKEAKIMPAPEENDEWLLINSLSCQPIIRLNKMALQSVSNPYQIWFSLLGKSTIN